MKLNKTRDAKRSVFYSTINSLKYDIVYTVVSDSNEHVFYTEDTKSGINKKLWVSGDTYDWTAFEWQVQKDTGAIVKYFVHKHGERKEYDYFKILEVLNQQK